MNMKKLNEEIEKLNEKTQKEFPELFTLNEMAELDGGIIIRNDNDDSKFSHFHWGGVHFNLFEQIPKNVTELKQRIHFKKEENVLNIKDLKVLFNILYQKSTKKAGCLFDCVYDFAVAQWELLNNREVDKPYGDKF